MAKKQQAKGKQGGKKNRGGGGGDTVSKYTSPGSLRMQARIRRQRRKNKRVERENKPSVVRALQRKYSGKTDPGYARIQKQKAAGRKHDRDEDEDDLYDDDHLDDGDDESDLDSDGSMEDIVRANTEKRARGGRGKKGKKNDDDDDAGDDGDDGYDDDDEGVEVESEIDEERIERLNESNPLGQQLFIRGVPKDADEAAITEHFSQYGEVRRVLLVQNSVTKRPSGSAFVHFRSGEAADAAYLAALRNAQEVTADVRTSDRSATDGLSHHQAKKMLHKLQQERFTSKEPFVTMQSSRVTVMRPLQRGEAQDMTSGGKSKKEKRTVTGQEDPRNLYLLEEGVIMPGSRAAENLHPKYMESLMRDYETRKQQLRNTNLFVSKTRLSVRNIPRNVNADQLRKMFLAQVRDLLRTNPALRKAEAKREWGKHGPIKNLRILVDRAGTSRGYGFVEFARHEYALHVLRNSNNNPTLFGNNNRLVVAFAIENINALQKLERLKKLRKERADQARMSGFVDRPGDDVVASNNSPATGTSATTTAEEAATEAGAAAAGADSGLSKREVKKKKMDEKRKARKKERKEQGGGAAASATSNSSSSAAATRGGSALLTTAHGVGAKPVLPSAAAAPPTKRTFSLAAHRAVKKKQALKRAGKK